MDMEFRQAVLPCGMQVIAECVPQAITTAIGFFVRTGARDETPAESGISHFLEHLVFKGSLSRTAWDVNRELDELGGQGNAYTGEEQTCYHTTVLPRYQDRATRLLCDLLRPALRKEDIESERLVVLEEIAKYDDQPPFGAAERLSELYFGAHPLAGRVLGTTRSVTSLSLAQVKDYFERRYAVNNIVCAAAGAVDFDGLVATLESESSTLLPARKLESRIPPTSPSAKKGRRKVPASASAYVLRASPAPSAQDPDRYLARIVTSLLGDEGSSRFFWELIDTGYAESATAWIQEYDDCGMFNWFLACDPADVKSCLKKMDQLSQAISQHGVTEEELKFAVCRTTSTMLLSSERPGHRMFNIGENWLALGRYESLDETLEHYRKITCDDVLRYAQRYSMKPLVEVRVMP